MCYLQGMITTWYKTIFLLVVGLRLRFERWRRRRGLPNEGEGVQIWGIL